MVSFPRGYYERSHAKAACIPNTVCGLSFSQNNFSNAIIAPYGDHPPPPPPPPLIARGGKDGSEEGQGGVGFGLLSFVVVANIHF